MKVKLFLGDPGRHEKRARHLKGAAPKNRYEAMTTYLEELPSAVLVATEDLIGARLVEVVRKDKEIIEVDSIQRIT